MGRLLDVLHLRCCEGARAAHAGRKVHGIDVVGHISNAVAWLDLLLRDGVEEELDYIPQS